MTIDPPISKVAVAGGGLAGWTAAAALKRHIPYLDVEIVDAAIPAESIVDRVISTLPSIMHFHHDLGLTEADTIARAGSGLRLGSMFENWANELPAYVHAYGNTGEPIEATPFHQQWLRAGGTALDSFDRFSPAAELGRAGRIGGGDSGSGVVSKIGYGLQLTLERYRELMRAYALHLGVAERRAAISGVELRSVDGFVDKLLLDDGATLSADLFVDCTGPAAAIRSRVGGEFIDWGRWLPCDRLIFTSGEAETDVELLDHVCATESGWRWSASSPLVGSHGAAFSSAHAQSSDVIDRFPEACRSTAYEIRIRQGRWTEPWSGNCVAIGDSAVAVEPLEWTNLHLVHSQIDRLVSMIPGRDCAPVELAEYNRQCSSEADRIRDFICLHYVTARRDEPFWRDAAAIEAPDSLAHTLSLFSERGRLPYHEEETFARDGWLAVLFGQGCEPRRIDPLADIVPVEEARQSILSYRDALKAFIERRPSYHQSMSNPGQFA
jgi:tryptophan halogenase